MDSESRWSAGRARSRNPWESKLEADHKRLDVMLGEVERRA